MIQKPPSPPKPGPNAIDAAFAMNVSHVVVNSEGAAQ
jgi:hypothetical protein